MARKIVDSVGGGRFTRFPLPPRNSSSSSGAKEKRPEAVFSGALQRQGESDATAFSRLFEGDLTIRKAHAISKGIDVKPVAVKPVTVETGRTDVESDAQAAYEALMRLAEQLRAVAPYMSINQAFEKVFADTANAELALRALRRRAAPHDTNSHRFSSMPAAVQIGETLGFSQVL